MVALLAAPRITTHEPLSRDPEQEDPRTDLVILERGPPVALLLLGSEQILTVSLYSFASYGFLL